LIPVAIVQQLFTQFAVHSMGIFHNWRGVVPRHTESAVGCVLYREQAARRLRNIALGSLARQQLDNYCLFQAQQQA